MIEKKPLKDGLVLSLFEVSTTQILLFVFSNLYFVFFPPMKIEGFGEVGIAQRGDFISKVHIFLLLLVPIIYATLFFLKKEKKSPGYMTLALGFWITLYLSVLSIPVETLLASVFGAMQSVLAGESLNLSERFGAFLVGSFLGSAIRGIVTILTFLLLISRKKI